ncbi:MAG: MFS transporter, partial [Gammaproteobacteria bacterium]|nr:MFS transporter [Gammaproteobacteria bacterium]MDP4869448.1 MFS transporter [Gammaproteobacteria bacterium]MDP5074537.1 MFS transporter [OM182 bacterium]
MFYTQLAGQRAPVSATDSARLIKWRLSTFWVMLIGYIGYYICRGNLSAAFPLLEQEFGYSNTQLGLIVSLSEIAYAVGKFINGPLADRIGGRRIFLVGMAGAVFWNLIFALSGTLTAFIVVWCCCRYFLSMGWGGLAKTIGSWYSSDKNGRVMGAISVSFQFGGAIAALFAGFLVSMGVSWQGVFVYPAIALSVIGVWAFFASKGTPSDVVPGAIAVEGESAKKQLADYGDDESPAVMTILKTLIKMPIYRQLLVFSFLTTLLRSVFLIWTPKFLFDIGQGASAAILKSAVFPLLGVAGTLFIGWYTDHYARNGDRARMMWIMLAVLVLCTFSISVLSAAENPNYNLIIFFLGGSGFFL